MPHTAHVVMIPDDDFATYFPKRKVFLAAIPRVGEYLIANDHKGKAHAHEVVAVLHPGEVEESRVGNGTATVEIFLKHFGTQDDVYQRYGTTNSKYTVARGG